MKFEPFVAYEASAGSGKTFQLTVRYLSLLFLDQSPQSILCVTFTKKAASEMRERIIDALNDLSPIMIKMIANETGLSIALIKEKKESVKQRFLKTTANILNIDKFFTKVLHSFSYEAGLDPNFQVTSQLNKDKLIDKFLNNIDNLDEFIKLFLQQSNSLEGLMNLFDTLYEIDPLLPQMNHNSNLKELENSCIEAMKDLQTQIMNCPQASAQVKGFVSFDRVDDIALKPFLQKASLSEHRNFKKCFNEALDDKFLTLKAHLKEYLNEKERYLLSSLLHFYQLYKEARTDRFKLQFNDITQKVFALLYGIDKEFLYFRLDAKYKHILIDEFQDTSLLQFYIFKPMIDEITSGMGQEEFRSFFYVGDVKQSIYRFRGGHKTLFYEVAKLYDITLKQMEKNFRSSKTIVSFVNENFHFMKGFTPQIPTKEGGFVAVEFIKDDEMMEKLEQAIAKLLQNNYQMSDICILTFKNKDAQKIENHLQESGFKVSTENSTKLTTNIKVASLISGMRYLIYKEKIDKEAFFYYCASKEKTINIDFHPSDQPFEVLSKLIEKYNHYNGDINIIKLLELSLQYKDILEFLNDDIDENAINQGVDGITLMTIHKSKGLEFKNCIIVDMLGKQRADMNKIIINNDGLSIEGLTYKFKQREFFDSNYASILANEERLKEEDLEHLLYVGCTRAQENLFLLAKEKDSKINYLNLKPLQMGELDQQTTQPQKTHNPMQIIQYKPIATQESCKNDSKGTLNYEATTYGTALHYCMEQLKSFDKISLDMAIQSTINRFGNLVDTDNIYKRVANLLYEPIIKELSSGTIIKEKPIIDNGAMKQIDMLVAFENKLTIVDYKTSNKNKLKDTTQVQEYIQIINGLTNLKTNGLILYILDECVEVVEV